MESDEGDTREASKQAPTTSLTGELVSKGLLDEKCESRLYIGNLDHRITESTVIKMFSPFGKIVSEDFLWHTRGPKRGEPRGFAFVEYSTKEEAHLAITKMDGRLACGRPLVVRFASEKDPVEAIRRSGASSTSRKSNVASGSAGQVTRSAMIAAIRNKLNSLEEGCSKKRTKCDP